MNLLKVKYIIKKCFKCGAIIKVINDCTCEDCGIKCCGENMKEITPNSVDAAIEKHVPEYQIEENKIQIKVNHVMEEEHYIEWISIVSNNEEYITYLKPGKEASIKYKYIPGSIIYAYCNKHGLWKRDVE